MAIDKDRIRSVDDVDFVLSEVTYEIKDKLGLLEELEDYRIELVSRSLDKTIRPTVAEGRIYQPQTNLKKRIGKPPRV